MIKYVVFDFDGTLVDSKAVFISVFNQLVSKYKLKKLEDDNLKILRKLSVRERCKYLGLPLYKIPFLSADLLSLYKNTLNAVVLIDGIKELVTNLKQEGYEIAIISSNSKENIRHFLGNNNIDTIDHIYCSSNILGKDKVIKKFLKTYNLGSSEIIYVGDEVRDITACKINDVEIVWVNWGYDAEDAILNERPNYIAKSPHDILDIVLSKKAAFI